jgi:hypothetical protein
MQPLDAEPAEPAPSAVPLRTTTPTATEAAQPHKQPAPTDARAPADQAPVQQAAAQPTRADVTATQGRAHQAYATTAAGAAATPAVSAAAVSSAVTTPASAPAAAPVAPAPAPAAATTPAPPAEQLAQAVGSIVIDPRGTGSVTVHLQPADLGAVSIRVAKTDAGAASVAVTVERSATLATLQADLGHLHQALDRAGVTDNRSVTLHLATTADSGGGSSRDQSQSGQNFLAGNGGFGQGGSAAGGQQGQARPQSLPTPSAPYAADQQPATQAAPTPLQTRRTGVNITA